MSNLLKSKFFLGAFGFTVMLAGVVAINTASASSCSITSTLRVGSKGAQVVCLQTAVGVKADGNFGKGTKAAVIAWQKSVGLTADGVFGKKSAAVLAGGTVSSGGLPAGCTSASGFSPSTGASCSGSTVVNNSGPLAVSLASDNPAAVYVIEGQAGADLAHFTFTGSSTINSITLQRTGVSDSNTLSNVYLYDGATRVTSGYSFNTTGVITMNNLGIVVNGSKILSVKADVASITSASTIGVALTSYTTAGNTAVVTNVKGNEMYVGTSTLAGSKFSITNVTVNPASAYINAGSMNQNLWSRTLTISQHAVNLHAMTVKMIGSAPSNSLQNVALFVDGVNVANSNINANSQYVFVLNSPLALTTGSHLIEVHGDIVSGAYRNFYLSLEQGTDISVEDSQMAGVYVSTLDSSDAVTINANGGTININQGTLTVNQDPSFNNITTLVAGTTATTLSSFKISAYGEDVKITSITFTPTFAGGFTPGTTLSNVGLYVNGGQVGSNQTATSGSPLIFSSLGSQLLVTAGSPAIVQLKGDIVSNTTGNVGAAVTAGTINFAVASGTAQGMSSSQTTALSGASGQTLTVASTNVQFAATTGFAASTVAPNTTAKIGSFTVQTASAEGVTVNTIVVNVPGSLNGTNSTCQAFAGTTDCSLVGHNQITNLTIKDDSTGQVIGTPIGNPVASGNSFSVTVPVAPSSTKVFALYADLGGTAALDVTPAMGITYQGAVSKLSTTVSPQSGVRVTDAVATIANATGTTLVSGSSPASQYMIGGSTIGNLATFNIVTSNHIGGAIIKDMTFTSSAGSINNIASVTVNGKTAQFVSGTAVVYNVGLTVPADNSGLNIPVGVSLVCANASSGCPASASNSTIILTLASYTFNDGSTIQTVSNAGNSHNVAPTHLLVASKPTITVATSTGAVLGTGSVEAIDVTVTADAAGSIKLNSFPITATISGGGSPTFTAAKPTVKDVNNTTLASTGSDACDGSATCAVTVVIDGGYTLNAGQSQTFRVLLPVTSLGTPSGSLPNTYMYTHLVAGSTGFSWSDVAGGTTITNTTYAVGYPSTVTSSVHN